MKLQSSSLRAPVDEAFLNEFATRIIQKSEGLAPEYSEVIHTAPKRLFFSAVLSTVDPEIGPTTGTIGQYRPTSCGLDFVVSTSTQQLNYTVRLAVFSTHYELQGDRRFAGALKPTLKYVRHICEYDGVLDTTSPHGFAREQRATAAIQARLNDIANSVNTCADRLLESDVKDVSELPATDNNNTSEAISGPRALQAWCCALQSSVSSGPDGIRVQLTLENCSEQDRERANLDKNLYGVQIQVVLARREDLIPTALERAPIGDYRYARSVDASGINCAAAVSGARISTVFSPSYLQYRYLPRKSMDLSFARLQVETTKVLEDFLSEMSAYGISWQHQLRIGDLGIESDEDLIMAKSFHNTFQKELERINEAVGKMKANAKALCAFELMTNSFVELNSLRVKKGIRPIPGWHMFQLGFILSALPDLLNPSRNSDTPAHLLWFPTGGGKTEAVMALAVFSMFYERLEGRKAGVSAWMRFPLRLLTFQQMQRYLEIVTSAEIIRRRSPEVNLLGGGAFSLGYFGGRNNSPNDLHWPPDALKIDRRIIARLKTVLRRQPTGFDVLLDNEGRDFYQDLRLVSDCPFCAASGSIGIYGNSDNLCLEHRCDACGEVLPLYIVDEDIYAQLPTVMVGTLDKLATIGFKKGFRTIVGLSDGRCSKHGFGVFGRCLKSSFAKCAHADWRSLNDDEATLGINILFQDELHLLNEQLGCFDGHYESLLMSACAENSGGKVPLVLAASATIEGADHQIDHLYGKAVIRFPGEGPLLRESFYAETTEDIQRWFIGMKPYNLAHLDTTMSLVTTIIEEQAMLRSRDERLAYAYRSLSSLTDTEYDDLIDRHALIVSYVNAKRDGQNILRSVEEQVRDSLERRGAETVHGVEFLSGDTEMDDVKSILSRMSKPRAQLPVDEQLDFVAATSMISHGVDVDRLNNMLFFSFPRTTAEYIQASSRSGRTFPGFVFVILKASTFRDRSFYKNFVPIHSAIDRLVETVPIDRFAIHAVERTLPGVALGLLLTASRNKLKALGISTDDQRELDNLQTLKRLLIGNTALAEAVKPMVDQIYLVEDPRAADWKDHIPSLLSDLVENIKQCDDSRSIPMGLNNTTTRVMTSLRDVEAPLEVIIRNRLGKGDAGDD